MRVGIPTEIKVQEFRVGITPAGVHALKEAGHTVLVQKGAGLGSMITDEEYVAAGAQIVDTAKECWDCGHGRESERNLWLLNTTCSMKA